MRVVEARFRALVAEWNLGRGQAAGLLGIDPAALKIDLVPRILKSTVERRLCLMMDIG